MKPLRDEPAVTVATITAAATALIGLLVAFGVPLTADQQTAILAVVAVAAPLAAGWWIRSRVSPVDPADRRRGGEHRREDTP